MKLKGSKTIKYIYYFTIIHHQVYHIYLLYIIYYFDLRYKIHCLKIYRKYGKNFTLNVCEVKISQNQRRLYDSKAFDTVPHRLRYCRRQLRLLRYQLTDCQSGWWLSINQSKIVRVNDLVCRVKSCKEMYLVLVQSFTLMIWRMLWSLCRWKEYGRSQMK